MSSPSVSLARLLAYHNEFHRAPVTLAPPLSSSRPPASSLSPQSSPPPPPVTAPAERARRRNGRAEPPRGKVAIQDRDDASDGQEGPWSREELERMDDKFVDAIQRALDAGKES